MKILITSGGRLATLLYDALKEEHELRVLRRRADPAFGASCVVGDVSQYDDVARAMEGCELVFHAAVRNNDDVELKNYE
jgi:nucleoside-diphosphate-sugar epimerase